MRSCVWWIAALSSPCQVFDPVRERMSEEELAPPLLIKPAHRDARWVALEPAGKAIRIDTRAGLTALLPRLTDFGRPVLLQEIIPGPETRIVSYHCYIDQRGEPAAEF